MNLPIYMDNHATTKPDPRVVRAMLPCFEESFGNPASTAHPFGWKAKELVDTARNQVAALASCDPEEVIFTSGATESINLVLKGIARNRPWNQIHIVTIQTEHLATLDTCNYLETLGARITRVPVLTSGFPDMDILTDVLQSKPTLLSICHGNNEIGVISPIPEIASLCHNHGVLIHVDAAQTLGKIPIRFHDWRLDFLSISGHKLYAPKGIGCLAIRRQVPPLRLTPLIHGGGHERDFRSGTLNIPGIVGMGAASEICQKAMKNESVIVDQMRGHLLQRLKAGIPDLIINGDMNSRLPGNLNISIPGIEGQYLLPSLRDHVSLSSGSACSSLHPRPSHVLAAIGRSDDLAHASLRFGLGRFNTLEEIEYTASIVTETVLRLRNQS